MSSKSTPRHPALFDELDSERARLEAALRDEQHAIQVANRSYELAKNMAVELALQSIPSAELAAARADSRTCDGAGVNGLLADTKAHALQAFMKKYPPPPRPLTEATWAAAKIPASYHALKGAFSTVQKSVDNGAAAMKAYAQHAAAVDQIAVEAQQALDRKKLEDQAKAAAESEKLRTRMKRLGILKDDA